MVLGAFAGGAVVFNGESPIYLSQIWPVLALPVAPLLTHGLTGRGMVTWRGPALLTVLAMAALCARYAAAVPTSLELVERIKELQTNDGDAASRWVRSRVSPECHVAGDASAYVPHFMRYPRFTSTRDAEVRIGSAYFGLENGAIEYWQQKNPDVVFGVLSPQLDAYVHERAYQQPSGGVWLTSSTPSPGCTVRRD